MGLEHHALRLKRSLRSGLVFRRVNALGPAGNIRGQRSHGRSAAKEAVSKIGLA